jgi:Zn finger protein HypA/HybF involved in hydrogenase expression
MTVRVICRECEGAFSLTGQSPIVDDRGKCPLCGGRHFLFPDLPLVFVVEDGNWVVGDGHLKSINEDTLTLLLPEERCDDRWISVHVGKPRAVCRECAGSFRLPREFLNRSKCPLCGKRHLLFPDVPRVLVLERGGYIQWKGCLHSLNGDTLMLLLHKDLAEKREIYFGGNVPPWVPDSK